MSSFSHVGKKTAWDVAKEMPSIWSTFSCLTNPTDFIQEELFDQLEKYTVLLYDKQSKIDRVDLARRALVAKGKTVDRIPPTSAALIQHAKRATYQAGHVWARSLEKCPNLPDVLLWGWTINDDNSISPFWTHLKEASTACSEFLKCKCKKGCKSACKCKKARLSCTELCLCNGKCVAINPGVSQSGVPSIPSNAQYENPNKSTMSLWILIQVKVLHLLSK